jgi:hemerythrin
VPILEWQENFNIGTGQFDVHHKHLVVLFNTTYDNFVSGLPSEDLGLILEALIDYAIYHFNAEERWMIGNGYAQSEEHGKMHNYFKMRVIEIQKDFLHGRNDASLETLTLLAGWLSNHILVADADFAEWSVKVTPLPFHKSHA